MKAKIATAGLMASVLLAPCIGAAQQQDSVAPPQPAAQVQPSEHTRPVRDTDITTKIKAKLAAQHLTSLGRIHVDTSGDGVVHLTGTARSQEAIDKAVEIAKGTEHVTSVTNDLQIRVDD